MTFDEAISNGDVIWYTDHRGTTALISRQRQAGAYRVRIQMAAGPGGGGINFKIDSVKKLLQDLGIPLDYGWIIAHP